MELVDEKKIKLIVGLGNPGIKYSGTRHNIGFELADKLAAEFGLQFKNEKKFQSEICSAEKIISYTFKKKKSANEETSSKKIKILIVKPQTFMNNSGTAIIKTMNFHKIALDDLLIAHDDVSLDTGKLRMSFDRGAGGQHGIEDTIQKLGGSKAFYRLKFGVGPDPGGERRSDYVLDKFSKLESELITAAKEQALFMIKAWLVNEDFQQLASIKAESLP